MVYPAVAKWPPEAELSILGYLTDVNHCDYSRDIGRSSTICGKVYHIFGDTFCKNDAGEFVGLVSNTASQLVDKKKPLESAYLSIHENGLVEPLLELNEEETEYEKCNKGHRYCLWAFGSIIEVEKYGAGLLWYEIGIDHNPGNGQPQQFEYLGIGLAKVALEHKTGKLSAMRLPDLLFGPHEPHFGHGLLDGDTIYLYGKFPDSGDIGLTKVHVDSAPDSKAYSCWTGLRWSDPGTIKAAAVYSGMQQGSVVRSPIFGKEYPYLFVGNNKWADSMIQIGRAPAPEGPWKFHAVAKAEGIKYPNGYMYCIYPHFWVAPEKGAAFMVTWSEHWPGGVVAAMMKLEVDRWGEKAEL